MTQDVLDSLAIATTACDGQRTGGRRLHAAFSRALGTIAAKAGLANGSFVATRSHTGPGQDILGIAVQITKDKVT